MDPVALLVSFLLAPVVALFLIFIYEVVKLLVLYVRFRITVWWLLRKSYKLIRKVVRDMERRK